MRKFLLWMVAMIACPLLTFAENETYELVTDASALANGDEVLIVYVNGSTIKAMGGSYNGSNYRSGVSVSIENETITLDATNTNVSRFTLGGSSGSWTLYSNTNTEGYLTRSSSTLTTTTTTSTNSYWSISINNNAASIVSTGSSSRYIYWQGSYFSLNRSSNNYIRIFKKKITVDTPVFSLAEGEYDEEQTVKLSTTTEGATIYYTTDGTTPTTSSTKYTGAITLGNGTTTINAIAVLNDVSSEVATATYVIKIDTEAFYLVTDASKLVANDTIILVYGTNSRSLGAQLDEGNRACTSVTITTDSIVLTKKDTSVTRICLGGSSSARTFYTLNNTEGYLFNSGADGYLNTQDAAGDYAKATISIAESGDATITFASEGSNKLLAHYLNPDAGPGGDDVNPPIVGAKPILGAPVANSSVVECFTFIDEINEDAGYHYVQIYKKKSNVKDINMDGVWSIADVTALVNQILGKEQENCDVEACDVNKDGSITIADVTALVNILLGK
ncbi:MAG: chitobiase/beta-hexosaminidase C-terminal domain-containing protein [Prevotella sp.]|nr:chitobiase/beta-hexosaminidase C-terminal domain-containing protein [Prevotella sp.]